MKDDTKETSDSLAETLAPMRKWVEQNKKIYVERHEYRPATDADFTDRDRAWYDAATAELARLGYRHIGDVVNQTIAKAMGLIVVIRRFISADGTNGASVYQLVPRSGKNLRTCDAETELSDGSFLTTSNAEASKAVSLPPQIRSTKHPADTPVSEIIARHEAAKQKLLAEQPTLSITKVHTAADYEAGQHRQEAIKAAFRKGIGYLDPAEIRRIAEQKMPDDPAAVAVATASADIARREEQAGGPSLLARMMEATDTGKSKDELGQMFVNSMFEKHPEVPADKKQEIADTMKNLLASTESDDRGPGMMNLFKLMGQLQELEPKEEREARRKKSLEGLERARAEAQEREKAHIQERLKRGLSAKTGTGAAEPGILFHALPIPDLDFQDVPRALGLTIKEIKASKARRDAQVLSGLPLGQSRVGGVPDLPPGQEWPTFKGKKVPFIAQLNLADFAKADRPLLPERGHLYAFTLISNEKDQWPPPVSVFLYQGETSTLVRAQHPTDEEIWPDWGGVRVYEILPATTTPEGRDPKKRSRKLDETLGHLQGEMAGVFGEPADIADYQFANGDDWINLLAIYSVGSMTWSDAGELYFLIRRSALEKLDFSNVIAASCSS
jgi:hypothetical protein